MCSAQHLLLDPLLTCDLHSLPISLFTSTPKSVATSLVSFSLFFLAGGGGVRESVAGPGPRFFRQRQQAHLPQRQGWTLWRNSTLSQCLEGFAAPSSPAVAEVETPEQSEGWAPRARPRTGTAPALGSWAAPTPGGDTSARRGETRLLGRGRAPGPPPPSRPAGCPPSPAAPRPPLPLPPPPPPGLTCQRRCCCPRSQGPPRFRASCVAITSGRSRPPSAQNVPSEADGTSLPACRAEGRGARWEM